MTTVKLTPEVLAMVNRAQSAIGALEGSTGRGVKNKELRKTLVLSLTEEITAARLRSVTWKAIAASIAENTGVKFTATALRTAFNEVEAEKLATHTEPHGSQSVQNTPRTVKRYGRDYNF